MSAADVCPCGCGFRCHVCQDAAVGLCHLCPPRMSRARAAGVWVHDTSCPDNRRTFPCPACPHPASVEQALAVLDVKPRAAGEARLMLHDRVCVGGVECSSRDDHAKRTQSRVVAALRKYRAQEHATT